MNNKTLLAGGEATLNNTGYMTGSLDPYSLEFIEYASRASGWSLDIGACFGVATLPALEKGAKIIALDNDFRHLEILRSRTPKNSLSRLKLLIGEIPDKINLEKQSVSAILCCRILHLLKPSDIELSIAKMYELLEQNGKLFIVNDTPFARYSDKMLTEFLPIYEQRKQQGIKWPGHIPDLKFYLQPEFHSLAPDFITLTGTDELIQACIKCGFNIIKSEFIPRPDYPPALQNDGRENAGIIAVKSI